LILVVSRLEQLSNRDLELQMMLIKGSLYSYTTNKLHSLSKFPEKPFNFAKENELTNDDLVNQSIKVALNLKEKSIINHVDDKIGWIAPQYFPDLQRFQLSSVGYSLYSGNSGIALFFASLAKVTNDPNYKSLALASIDDLCNNWLNPIFVEIIKTMGIGGSDGLGSLLYTLFHISNLLDRPTIRENINDLISLVTPDIIDSDRKFDVISGSAGTILGLLAFSSISQEALHKAFLCGEHLLKYSVDNHSEYGNWINSDGNSNIGFSHGIAGIAYALLRLYKVTGEIKFFEVANEAIKYEQSILLKKSERNLNFLNTWCNGLPGISLARLATLDILDTSEIQQEIEVSINTTLQNGLSDIDHLCCGNMGRVEFLFTAGNKLNRHELIDEAMKLASQVIARTNYREDFMYGSILGFNPGFFQGSAGIGYELLRLAYPDQLPSVLLWE
jgi:type 2 lantibiotic biosynthesis protein LanM